jgi:hypothetical protein
MLSPDVVEGPGEARILGLELALDLVQRFPFSIAEHDEPPRTGRSTGRPSVCGRPLGPPS